MTSEAPAEVPAEAEKKSRAGRNVPASIAVGVGLLAVVVASLFIVKDVFVAVVVIALGIGLYELARAFATAGIRIPVLPVLTGGTIMLVGGFYGGMETASIAMALTVIGTLVWRLAEGADGFVRDTSAGIFALSYLFLMGVFVMLMLLEDDGPWRVVAFIVATIASDIGGFVAGVLFGKHPMAPTISPKKSWEGFAGSLIVGIAAGIGTVTYGLDGHWWAGVILGIAGVVFATLGDLSESLIKRDLGIKDMGDLLPGHGGIMDRLDSLIAVAPIAWLILHTLVKVSQDSLVPLTDGDHIRGLLGTYCRLIDAGDFTGLGRLMADAVLMTEDGTVIATGADEVAALYGAIVTVHEDGTPGTQHVVANTSLEEVEGGGIRARSAYVVFQAVPELPLQPVVTGSYVDTFERDSAGAWRFAERRFGIGRSGDLSHHLVPGVIG